MALDAFSKLGSRFNLPCLAWFALALRLHFAKNSTEGSAGHDHAIASIRPTTALGVDHQAAVAFQAALNFSEDVPNEIPNWRRQVFWT